MVRVSLQLAVAVSASAVRPLVCFVRGGLGGEEENGHFRPTNGSSLSS